MKLLKLTFHKKDLDALSNDEQVFLIHLTWLTTETMNLRKLLIISANNLKKLSDVSLTAARVQSFFFIRLLAGKLYEGWNILQESYFKRSDPDTPSLKELYASQLSKKANDAIDALNKYFGQGNNLIKEIRHKYSFHYDRESTDELLQQINPEEELAAFVAEEAGNSLYVFSDDLTTRSILDSINTNDHRKALIKLFSETLKVAKWFDDLTHEVILIALGRCNYQDKDIILVDVPSLNELELPYFVSRPSDK